MGGNPARATAVRALLGGVVAVFPIPSGRTYHQTTIISCQGYRIYLRLVHQGTKARNEGEEVRICWWHGSWVRRSQAPTRTTLHNQSQLLGWPSLQSFGGPPTNNQGPSPLLSYAHPPAQGRRIARVQARRGCQTGVRPLLAERWQSHCKVHMVSDAIAKEACKQAK